MFRTLLLILQQYGLQTANLCLLLFLAYKLANNHLKHIADGIKENTKKLTDIDTKLDGVTERVAKLEGRVE